jgi:hypothetical protein
MSIIKNEFSSPSGGELQNKVDANNAKKLEESRFLNVRRTFDGTCSLTALLHLLKHPETSQRIGSTFCHSVVCMYVCSSGTVSLDRHGYRCYA